MNPYRIPGHVARIPDDADDTTRTIEERVGAALLVKVQCGLPRPKTALISVVEFFQAALRLNAKVEQADSEPHLPYVTLCTAAGSICMMPDVDCPSGVIGWTDKTPEQILQMASGKPCPLCGHG